MNILALSSLLASIVTLAIGASVLLRDRTRRTFTTFAAFTLNVSLWHLLDFVAKATESSFFSWLALWPAATIPPTALRFFRHFLAEPTLGRSKPRPPRVTLVWTGAAYLALTYSAVRWALGHGTIHHEAWFRVPIGIYVFGGLYRCVYDLYAHYRATVTRVEKTRVRYLMLGGFVATTLLITDYLPAVGVGWPTIGNVLTILYLYFLSQTLFRYRLLDINELVGQMVVLGTLVLLLSGVYGLLIIWIGGTRDAPRSDLFLLNTLVASFVILILFEPVRGRLESTINRWLLRQRHELRSQMATLRRELRNVVDPVEMVAILMRSLEESRRVTHASLYLLDSDSAGYDRIGHLGEQPPERIEVSPAKPFLDRLRGGRIDLAELRREAEYLEAVGDRQRSTAAESLDAIARMMADLKASLVVPIYGSEETEQGRWLIGMLAVRDDRDEASFSLDDIDVFTQMAAQCTLTLEATQAYERMRERDHLAAIGQMAAGLAHEIRNPLGAIKGAAQLLIGPGGKPAPSDESGEFLDIIVQEVDRLNDVVTQFLDYARMGKEQTTEHVQLDLNDVVRKTVQLLETYDSAEGVDIELKLDELLPIVNGDPEQLRQVFLNLGLNSLQAMQGVEGSGGKRRLEIITTRRRRSSLGYGSFAEVRFRDTGPGIPHDKQKSLFIPFYTTKEKGTGLGLAISQRIVTQHSGTIEVRSRPGQGATFSVFLPGLGPSLAPGSDPPQPGPEMDPTITQPMSGFRADEETTGERPADSSESPANPGS